MYNLWYHRKDANYSGNHRQEKDWSPSPIVGCPRHCFVRPSTKPSIRALISTSAWKNAFSRSSVNITQTWTTSSGPIWHELTTPTPLWSGWVKMSTSSINGWIHQTSLRHDQSKTFGAVCLKKFMREDGRPKWSSTWFAPSTQRSKNSTQKMWRS